jgi:hypothetical protein
MTRTARNRRDAALSVSMRRRILAMYDSAPDTAKVDGERWYETARLTAQAIAGAHGRLNARQVAGIIAALSPRVSWPRNVAAAYRVVEAVVKGWPLPYVDGYGPNRRKAWDIANGADPDAILGGPKVVSFYRNLIGCDESVTIDCWAARAAEGVWNPRPPTGRRYETLARAYRDAARLRNVTPRAMQATVWCAVRNGSSIEAANYIQPSIWQ